MSLSMSSLLVHDLQVPAAARALLAGLRDAPESERFEAQKSAARILMDETNLDCSDVRELVDLPDCGCE